jgi:hypothetical protein
LSITVTTTRVTRQWLMRKSKDELASIILANLDRIDLFGQARDGKDGSDKPLTVVVTGTGELSVSIGANVLANAFIHQDKNNPFDESKNGFKRLYRVTDALWFADEVRWQLCSEKEDGSTLLTHLIDKACWNAIEDGCLGVEEDGRIDPPVSPEQEAR